MAPPSVQTETCRHCGAEIREGSAFCYHCGKELFPNPASNGKVEADSIPLGDLSPAAPAAEAVAVADDTARVRPERRRRSKRPEPEVVEVTWEPVDGPSTFFYVVSIVLAAIALLLTALALYLR